MSAATIGDFSAEEKAIFEERKETLTLASGREIDNPILVFERLARESGAECYFPSAAGGLNRAIEAVAKELQTEYTLAYYPEASTKSYRHIQVKVRLHGLKVFTRHGFSTNDASIHFSVDACAISPQEHPYPYESKLAPREGGGLVYHEDFTDPQSGWPLSDSSWYGLSEYHIVRKGSIELLGEGSVCGYGPWWNDGQFSVSVKLSTPPNHAGWITSPGAGLVFRLNDRGYYALLIGLAPGVQAKLIAKRFDVPQAIDLMPWTRVDDRLGGPSEWNRLRVECHGDLVVLFVNNRELGKVRDTRFEDGYVGMTLFGAGHAVFRELIAKGS